MWNESIKLGNGESEESFLGFFDQTVLGSYRSQPDKCELTTDNFEGHLTNSRSSFESMDQAGDYRDAIDIRFGYRTLANGDLAVVVFGGDLMQRSKGHRQSWMGFNLNNIV